MFLFNYFIVLINILNTARYLQIMLKDSFDNEVFRDYTFFALMVIILNILLIVIFPSTDMLQYPSYFGGLVLFICMFWMWGMCFSKGPENLHEMKMFSLEFPPFIGGYTYCILCVGCLVTGEFCRFDLARYDNLYKISRPYFIYKIAPLILFII